MAEKKWDDCMVVGCDEPGAPRVCPGDGRTHGHGAIHTAWPSAIQDGEGGVLDLGPWGLICAKHYAMADAEWTWVREQRSTGSGEL